MSKDLQFGSNHYVPILKAKQGELDALQHLVPSRHAALTPLLEVPPVPTDPDDGSPTKTVDDHLARHPGKVVTKWGTSEQAFVDLGLLDPSDRMNNGQHPLIWYFDALRTANGLFIPTTALDRDSAYQVAAATVISTDKRGVCIRVTAGDAYEDAFPGTLEAVLTTLGVRPQDVHLVIDLAEVDGDASTTAFTARALITGMPHIRDWRTLTLAGTAFPENLTTFNAGYVGSTPRTEWDVWTRIRSGANRIPRMPTFGDYAISHTDLFDGDPRVMRPSASIRYTIASDWLIFRGRSVRGSRYGGFSQFHALSQSVVQHPSYCGRVFSWGDEYIAQCANRAVGTGSLTTWRAVATNHHLTFVADQIATLSAPSGAAGPGGATRPAGAP